MGTTLTGSAVASTYDALLKTTDNGPVTGSLKTVTDGLGNDTALQVSSAGVKSTGTFSVDGATTLTGAVTAPAGVTGPLTGNVTGDLNGQVGNVTPAAGAFTTLAASGLISANGGQIKFPATQSASSDANTLDDYEEGTWVPSLGGTATYTTQAGTYTKIGRIVHINGRLTINSIGTGSTGVISGLPFTAGSDYGVSVGWFQSIATTGYVSVSGFVVSGTTTIHTSGLASGGDGVTSPANIFKSGTDIIFSATYAV